MTSEVKPRRVVYLLPLAFLIAAGIPSGAVLWNGIEGIRAPLKRMLGPGNQQVAFDKAGKWTVFYEYRSVVDGRQIATSPVPPPLDIKLTSPSGTELEASPSSVPLTYQTPQASGVSVASFVLDDPGLYSVSVTATSVLPEEEMVVAFGHEKTRSLQRVISGAILLGATVFVGLIGLGVILFLRVRSKRRVQLATPAWEMPPPPPGF